MLAAIPAPPFSTLGPIHLYGIVLALAVIAAWQIAERRWRDRGHNPEEIASMAIWVIIWGVVVGARVYHLFTGYDWDRNGFIGIFKIWNGGLSIWGGLIGGTIAAVVIAVRRKMPVWELLDTLAPAIAVAQAIGRWGNYFNQELFGRPTTLPWGLEVAPEVATQAGYAPGTTFHPTFLYESLWCLGIFVVLTVAEKRFGDRWRIGWTVCGYLALYTLGRSFFEQLRIDKAVTPVGTSFNFLLSVSLCVIAVGAFIWIGLRGRKYPGPPHKPEPAAAPPPSAA